MSYYEKLLKYKNADFAFCGKISEQIIKNILDKEILSQKDFLLLLSPKARPYLELIAKKAQKITRQFFGKNILLYAPIYVANFCMNGCAYCSFSSNNKIKREILSLEQVESEAKALSALGIRHMVLVCGESSNTSIEYLANCVKILSKYFYSISLEVYPLDTGVYKKLFALGADGVTIYQEVYDEEIYGQVHLRGPKTNYLLRLDAPERACKAGARNINIGPLLGLNDPVKEIFSAAMHIKYLEGKYPDIDFSLSFPRIKSNAGNFTPKYPLDDKTFVHIMLACRIFLPRAGITLSTRESAYMRDNILPLCITKMSAQASTKVGGYSISKEDTGQFENEDRRSVEEIKNQIYGLGYQPVFKDWLHL
ncbi:MAG: 2-iminoacetate synthase ThiH [Elusimicrobiota bacterium]|jgi:2-iminoacetate synthase|nr:2-iminoacetate synthase ThiH [Elusimicrobiota bacterium]